MVDSVQQRPVVRFGRRQSKGVLLGFSGPRVTAIGCGLVVFVAAMFLLGTAGLAAAAPVWMPLFALAFVRSNGDPLADAAPTLAHWGARRAAGQTRYRRRVDRPRPVGTMALPGDAAPLRFHVDAASGAAMVHDPHRRTLTAALRVSHPAYVLLSRDDQTARVAAWGRMLAGLAASGSCAGIQILESTLPDPGHGVRDWFAANATDVAGWPVEQYAQLMEHVAPASQIHRTLVAVSLDLRRAARSVRAAGRGLAGAADVLRGDMTALTAALRAADLRTEGWLDAAALAGTIRETYDPTVDAGTSTAGLSTAGPVAIDEHWDHLRHDSAYSAVMWISEWPRVDVPSHFLHSLVFLQDVRKTVSICAKPLDTATALRAIRKEKVEYVAEAQQIARIGKLTDAAEEQEYSDVLTRERALIAGHADLRFSGFVTVTAPTRDQLAAEVASTQRAATQSGCETRILFGQQAQAFTVAALPLGRGAH